MKLPFILLITTSLIAVSATDPPVRDRVMRTETIVSVRDEVDRVDYTYDAQGRCISSVDKKNHFFDCYIDYGHDTIYYHYPAHKKTPKRDVIYTLGPRGYIAAQDGKGTFTYDSSGILISRFIDSTHFFANSVSSGDQIAFRYTEGERAGSSTSTYYPEADHRYFGTDFWGHHAQHLLKSTTIYMKTDTLQCDYTYAYDAQGRVKSETSTITHLTQHIPAMITIVLFTYAE